jgi:pSer/pThr/pTyr-binding forkhead associated (FHA) protein
MIQIEANQPAYDDRHYVLLRGREGVAAGERLKVSLGETVYVGRSRSCQFSLKKTPAFLRDRDGARRRIRSMLGYRSTSRRHVRIAYLAEDLVEIENLSRNGTLVDGHRVDRLFLRDARRERHEIRLGRHGDVLVLEPGSLPIEASRAAVR